MLHIGGIPAIPCLDEIRAVDGHAARPCGGDATGTGLWLQAVDPVHQLLQLRGQPLLFFGEASSRASENLDAQAEESSAAAGSSSAAVRSNRSRVICSVASFPRPRSLATWERNVSHSSVPAAETTAAPPAAASAAMPSVNM